MLQAYLLFAGNSAYGRCLLNAEGQKTITYHKATNAHEVSGMVNRKQFYDLTEFADHSVEISSLRRLTRLNVPPQIGFFVLEHAKLLLLRFYYDFLLKYIDMSHFVLVQMDTDSIYAGLGGKTFLECIRPSMRKQYISEHEQWMVRSYCDSHKRRFFKRSFKGRKWVGDHCCQVTEKYYLRQAGLFHIENISDGIIALCPKAYYCVGENPKFSAKGVKKAQNKLTEDEYKDVLFNQKISTCTNRGIRKKGTNLFTYVQTKKGLNYFYGKRIVCSDHVTTLPTKL